MEESLLSDDDSQEIQIEWREALILRIRVQANSIGFMLAGTFDFYFFTNEVLKIEPPVLHDTLLKLASQLKDADIEGHMLACLAYEKMAQVIHAVDYSENLILALELYEELLSMAQMLEILFMPVFLHSDETEMFMKIYEKKHKQKSASHAASGKKAIRQRNDEETRQIAMRLGWGNLSKMKMAQQIANERKCAYQTAYKSLTRLSYPTKRTGLPKLHDVNQQQQASFEK